MSNQRSVMTEFRFLDQKRQAEGLTADEAARYAQLRDLVGPETAGPPRSGFDVNAAAARLRESLLPAGLRSRPAEAAPPPPPEPPPAEAPRPEAEALEQAWAEAPFAELTPGAADPLFDPGSLAQEVRPQAWNPEAPGYDPDAPYDEAAWIAAGYDPTATYDWSAYGYGPDGQPLTAGEAATSQEGVGAPALEAPAEPPLALGDAPAELAEAALAAEPLAGGEAAWDAAPVEVAPEAWGAPDLAAPFEIEPPSEHPWGEPAAEPPAAPGVEQAWGALTAEPALQLLAEEPEPTPALEPSAPAPVEPAPDAELLPFDSNAPFDHAKWFGRAGEAAAAPEPSAEPELLAAPEPLAFGEYDATATATQPGSAPDLLEGAEPAALDPSLPEPEAVPVADGAAPASDWLGDAPPAAYQPAPANAPFGDYDEAGVPADGTLAAMLSFDPAAASAIEPGALPEGYEPGGPALDPSSLPPVVGGGYDEAVSFSPDQMYGGPEGDALPGGAPLELGEGLPDWQPEAALEQGFELASDGSFGHGEPPNPRTPAWGTAAVAMPGEGWESAPALDLGSPFEQPSLTPPGALEALPPAAEELPTIDGAELLEELPPEEAPPAAATAGLAAAELAPADLLLEAEPALAVEGSPLDGAFEGVAAVEAAAYPAPDLEPSFADLPAEAAPTEPPAPEPEYLEVAEYQEPAAFQEAPLSDLPPEIAAAYASEEPAATVREAEPAVAADTFELPPAVADGLFEASPEPEPLEAEPLPPPPPAVEIPGTHRVVLHTSDGQVKRGLLVDALLDAPTLPLRAQGPGAPDEIPTETIKAIFFMLSPGEQAPAPTGKKVRVTFRDGRQVAGFSPDYQEGLVGFFMIPADTRTNTGRIWVYQAAVKAVAVS